MKKVFSIVFLFLVLSPVFSQNDKGVKFSTSTNKTEYYEFEYVYYTYTIENAEPRGIESPNFEGFKLLDHRVRSSNGSFSISIIVNGKSVQKGEQKYEVTFILQPLKRGALKLPEGKFTYNGTTYNSPAKTVYIKRFKVPDSELKKEHFVWVETSNHQPYVGQSFTLNYTIFSRNALSDENQFPNKNAFINFGDFSVKEIERFNSSRVNIKGNNYYMMQFQKHLLTPVTSGKQVIPSFEIDYISYQIINDGWFGRKERIDKKVTAPQLTITVKDLPNRPAGFKGLVGDFKFTSKLDKNKVPLNDAVTVKYILSGSGNFEAIDQINPDFPGNWEVFDPSVSKKLQVNSNGKYGSKVFEYVTIPRKVGEYEIDRPSITYFDPYKNKYITLKPDGRKIEVYDDGKSSDRGDFSYRGLDSKKVELLNEDIRFIKKDADLDQKESDFLVKSIVYKGTIVVGSLGVLFGLFLPLIVRLVPNNFERRERKFKEIIQQIRNSNASNLKLIEGAIEDYWELSLGIKKSEQSAEVVRKALLNNEVEISNVNCILKIISDLSISEYAKGSINFEKLQEETVVCLKDIEKELLNKRDLKTN